jgi:tRNA nucleotidyltransferase (CCA-adding enzyme)
MNPYKELHKIISPLYQVGGSVRDELLNRTARDYDFATPLLPDDIESRIRTAGKRPYLVGKRYGTVGIKLHDKLVEITTFRSDKYVSGSRLPKVSFVPSIVEDLARRDLTINAMARTDEGLIDPFGGALDIKARLIRCVGSPGERFSEDPLRMLRCVRFVADLGFEIEAETARSIDTHGALIISVSEQRIASELDKLLISDHWIRGLFILDECHLLRYVLPELHNSINHQYLSVATTVFPSEAEPNLADRWAILLKSTINFPFSNSSDLAYLAKMTDHIMMYQNRPKTFAAEIKNYISATKC